MTMFTGGIEILILIPYIGLTIFMICVLIRLYDTLYYARKAYKKYLAIDPERRNDNSENVSTENDVQQSKSDSGVD